MKRDLDLPLVAPQAAPVRSSAIARLVEYAPGRLVALPVHTTLEIVERPVALRVPGGAAHAYGLLAWQGQRVPMIDLGVLLFGGELRDDSRPAYALVVAYQTAPSLPLRQGAIAMNVLPQTVIVDDSVACALPVDSERWMDMGRACFMHEGQGVPIWDTSELFRRIRTHEPASAASVYPHDFAIASKD